MAGEATDDAVDVERDLALRDGGVLVTYSLAVPDDRPVAVDVVDDLPSNVDRVREIGVHPEFEPADAEVDEERIVFRDTVDPDDGLVVKYGITTADPVDEGTIATWGRETPPRVEAIEDGMDAPPIPGGAGGALSNPADAFASAKDSPPGTGDGADGVMTEDGLDLGSGDDAIIDDLTGDGEADGPRDFVAEVSDGADGFAADASTGLDAAPEAEGSDSPTIDGDDGLSAMADELAAGSTVAIRVDRFRSRLTALAGSSLALHAVEDDAVAEAFLSGMADELDAVNAEFEALRGEFGGEGE